MIKVVLEVKNPPANAGDTSSVLGWEDPREEGMATHSRILAWWIPMDRGAWGCKELDMTERLNKKKPQQQPILYLFNFWHLSEFLLFYGGRGFYFYGH